jgi:hypothetical protein
MKFRILDVSFIETEMILPCKSYFCDITIISYIELVYQYVCSMNIMYRHT